MPADVIPFDQHPLMDEGCCIPTEELEIFCNEVIAFLKSRQPGIVFTGTSRAGKSSAAEFFQRNHRAYLGKEIPIYMMEMWTKGPATQSTENRFFGYVLDALGYELPNSGVAPVKLDRAVKLVISACESLGDKRALFIIDEGQGLGHKEYGYLMDLFNPLRRKGIRFKVLIVGQEPAMEKEIGLLSKYPQIKARFHRRVVSFRGLSTKVQLQRILRIVDAETEFPEESGWTFTAFFLPKAYNSGFRLESLCDSMWMQMGKSLVNEHGFSMQDSMDVITELLLALAILDKESLDPEDPAVVECIQGVCIEIGAGATQLKDIE